MIISNLEYHNYMKIIVLILIIVSSIFGNSYQVYASERYARIENSSIIYSQADENTPICIAEKSYFVQILNDMDDKLKVYYNGISGYIKKNDVKEITSIPNTPYPSNIKLIVGSPCNLRNSPTTKDDSNNIIASLKSGENDIEFVGRIFSDEAIDFGGTTWFLVKYQGKYGYVYNKYLKSTPLIIENTEKISYLSSEPVDIQNPITHTPSLILIIIMAIPLLFILIILYLPSKQIKKTKKQKPIKIIHKY